MKGRRRAAGVVVWLSAIGVLAVVLLTGLMAYTDAISAAALGGAGSGASTGPRSGDARYYRSAVSTIEPAVPGLTVGTQENGMMTLANHTGDPVTVFGYGGEPYLRIGPDGVDENVNSLSAALNSGAGPALNTGPADTRPQLPHWEHRGDGTTATWRDYRTHLSDGRRPAVVAADPHRPHQVLAWTMLVSVGDQPVSVTGVLRWTGAPRLSHGYVVLLSGVAVPALLLALLVLGRYARLMFGRRADERAFSNLAVRTLA